MFDRLPQVSGTSEVKASIKLRFSGRDAKVVLDESFFEGASEGERWCKQIVEGLSRARHRAVR